MTAALLVELLLSLLTKSTEISNMIATMQKEGRAEMTPEEWAKILNDDAAARTRLAAAVEAAKVREAAAKAGPL